MPPLPVPREGVLATRHSFRRGGAITARGSAAEAPRRGRGPEVQTKARLDPLVVRGPWRDPGARTEGEGLGRQDGVNRLGAGAMPAVCREEQAGV
eukprot:12632579-Alexandrium_andersonii.AAC.1